jgi:hypothetical protein
VPRSSTILLTVHDDELYVGAFVTNEVERSFVAARSRTVQTSRSQPLASLSRKR